MKGIFLIWTFQDQSRWDHCSRHARSLLYFCCQWLIINIPYRVAENQTYNIFVTEQEKETISAHAYAYLKQEAPSNSSFCTFSYSYNSREEGHMFVIMLCSQSVATIT